ncbi:hypothetical protein MBLNU13_g06674t1 [Cladosporium sp. NU13]
MENKTARPVGSHNKATRANINQPVAVAKQPKPWERSLYPRAAPIHSRPGPARNSSTLQGVSGTGGATPFAAPPSMRGRAVRDVGFENWAFRNESIMAHPVRAPRGRPSRIPIAILEEDEDEESDVLPALPSPSLVPKTSELPLRWQGDRARRAPAVVRPGAHTPIRSHAASLVAATESATPAARHSWPKRASRPAVLMPSSPLRHSIGHAPENPRTYLDMHARYTRPSTRRWAQAGGPALDLGENFSPCSAGTTVKDIRRRAGLGLKAPLPGNAVLERRAFEGPFVDAPSVIGEGREMRGVEREEEVGGSEVVPLPAPLEERKKGWQRVSAFLARKMSRKEKRAAPSSASSDTPSQRTPTTPPALVYGGSSSDASPAARAPGTPPQVRFATPVVISEPPDSTPRMAITEKKKKKQPVSPPKTALKWPSPPCSKPQKEHFARAITAASALAPRRGHPSPPISENGEEEEEEDQSPLSDVDDADLFPSPLLADERWARPEEPQHEAVADALAEETAAADWAGALKQAERVQYVGKGKGRVVDVKARPARYHGRRVGAEEAPVADERRDTLVGERVPGAWPLDEVSESKRPVIAISGLHR